MTGRPPPRLPRLRTALGVLSLTAAFALAVCWSLLPGPFLPAPTGPHPIGTAVFTVVDGSRREIFGPDPDAPRTLTAQLWYPAAHAAASIRTASGTPAAPGTADSPRPNAPAAPEPYLPDPAVLDPMLEYAHLPRLLFARLAHAPTHAIADAAPADGRFPVVFFLTGNMGYRGSNLVQIEELASHGYVVVGLDQPGVVGSAETPAGRIPYAGRTVVKPLVDQSFRPWATAPVWRGVAYPRGIVPYLAADPRAVLDRLSQPGAPLAGRLDLARVGAFGISLGGLDLSQWCATDARLRACLFLDAPMSADASARGLGVPSLWLTRSASAMRAEGWPDVEVRTYAEGQRALFERTRADAWYLEVAGARHADFTDAPYESPLPGLAGITSPGDGVHLHEVMRRTTVAFFDRTLRGDPSLSVLDASPWPDVSLTRR